MGKLLLALLKLLVQLLIFVLTGSWPRFGKAGPRRAPGPPGQPRPPPRAPRRPPARFEPSAARTPSSLTGSREGVRAPLFGSRVEARASTFERQAGGRGPAGSVTAEPGRRSLARALRDPAVLRDAAILAAASRRSRA
jgi:hypothetical protein